MKSKNELSEHKQRSKNIRQGINASMLAHGGIGIISSIELAECILEESRSPGVSGEARLDHR